MAKDDGAARAAANGGARSNELARHMEAVVRKLLGEPNRRLSTKDELRFGTHGSLSVDLQKGTWFSHEDDDGGGVLDLIARETRGRNGEALVWLRDELGIVLDDRPSATGGKPRGKVTARYVYRDEQEALLYRILRREPKSFSQERFDADKQQYVGGKGALDGVRRVLFRLPELLAADPAETVLLAEGEKDVLTLVEHGFLATTSAQGAGNWRKTDSRALAGRHVVIVPDRDAAGAGYEREAAQDLAGRAASLRVVHLPIENPSKTCNDVSDWFEQRGGTAEELRRLIEAAPPWQPEAAGWPEPEPLHEAEPLPAFPVETMGPWQGWCIEQAEVASAPVDYVAMPLVTVAGATIANSRWGSPWPGWKEPPVVNVAKVGLPSSGKSPGADTVLDPLRQAERLLARGFDETHRQWRTRKAEAEARLEKWKLEVKEAVKVGTPAPEMPPEAEVPPEPRLPRLLTTDATVEAAAELLAHEPKGIALVRDELAGFIGSMDKYGGSGGDRAFWLESYGGRAKVIDRLKFEGRPLRVEHLSIPILGGIQPDRLRNMVLAADDDGFAARLCYVWPALAPLKRPTARPDPERLVAAFVALRQLDMAVDGTTGDARPVIVEFSEPAAAELQRFRVRSREREQDAAGVFCGWLGKNPGRVVRIACILEHLWWAWDAAGPLPAEISERAVQAAIGLVEEYLVPHAERVFDEAGQEGGETQTAKDAQRLADWIASRKDDPPTLKDVLRLSPTRRLRRKEVRDAAIALLEEKVWLRKEKRESVTVLILNPALVAEV
jgi:hypothetical protein